MNPAHHSTSQNLVACQTGTDIYFYTIRSVQPNSELLVWYCREFALRLNYPFTGEQMLMKISKYSTCKKYLEWILQVVNNDYYEYQNSISRERQNVLLSKEHRSSLMGIFTFPLILIKTINCFTFKSAMT